MKNTIDFFTTSKLYIIMLKGEHVSLKPLEKKHIDQFLKWFNDPEITQYLLMYRPLTRMEEEDWFNDLKNRESDVYFSIVIENKDGSEKLIGNCAIRGINNKDRVGNFGIVIGEKEFQGKGYGTEAMKLLVDYGFNTLNLNRAELSTFTFNIRAHKSYLKVGFIEEGRKRQAVFKNGEYYDEIMFSILRSEWNKRKSI
ncbi:MAG: GNAT family N-acetyltransferase [Promethearchaeota archaeon]